METVLMLRTMILNHPFVELLKIVFTDNLSTMFTMILTQFKITNTCDKHALITSSNIQTNKTREKKIDKNQWLLLQQEFLVLPKQCG